MFKTACHRPSSVPPSALSEFSICMPITSPAELNVGTIFAFFPVLPAKMSRNLWPSVSLCHRRSSDMGISLVIPQSCRYLALWVRKDRCATSDLLLASIALNVQVLQFQLISSWTTSIAFSVSDTSSPLVSVLFKRAKANNRPVRPMTSSGSYFRSCCVGRLDFGLFMT